MNERDFWNVMMLVCRLQDKNRDRKEMKDEKTWQ
jgi:hypothetical protein